MWDFLLYSLGWVGFVFCLGYLVYRGLEYLDGLEERDG